MTHSESGRAGPSLSIVSPCHNEAPNIDAFCARTSAAAEKQVGGDGRR